MELCHFTEPMNVHVIFVYASLAGELGVFVCCLVGMKADGMENV